MASPQAHSKLNGSVPPQWDHSHTKCSHHHAHGDVWHIIGVCLTTLELKGTVVAREQASESYKHFTERRMDIEVELALKVMRAEFAKVRLVPDDDVGLANGMIAGPT
jgi:hypothetical protein